MTTLITELAKQNSGSSWAILQRAISNSLKNPVVISLVAGLIWAATGFKLSPILVRVLDFPADAAAPVGLFAVGLSLTRVKLKGDMTAAIIPVLLKMAVLPAGVYLMMTQVLNVSALWVNTTTLAACMPTGMAAYSIAEQNGIGSRRAASTILLGAMISAFSLMLAVSLLI